MLMEKRTYDSASQILHLFALSLTVLAISSLISRGDDFSRKGKVDLLVPGTYWDGEGFDAIAGGLIVNGHLTEHFALGLEGTIGSADVGRDDGLFYSALLSVEYNILKSRFTPFVAASAGVIGFEVVSGSFIFGKTEETNRGAFGGGVGLRWDVTDHFLIKASYRAFDITGGRHGGLAHMFEIGLGGSF